MNESLRQDLTGERWRRLQSLFDAAVELPCEARTAYLECETAGDLELLQELEAMLAHVDGAAERIARTIGNVAQQVAFGRDWIGKRLGPYLLIREIGRGGMGLVFEARRDDSEYQKTVALKVAPAWRDLDRLRETFRNERQILAGLEHPNIARFLDGGAEDGIPYFAMEYVEGCPIVRYCQERSLGLHDRIQLFRQVCAAVRYAHENLVVHRDLKPSNILVNGDGAPKLLDFGIAKLLSPRPEEELVTTGLRLWTPDYTSPEQIRGRPVTTRTDVYSLGLILYEMLCGERAQVADVSSPRALDRSICEIEPAAPSVRAEARGDRALARQLRGDLDTIVAMAIRKEPERRYGSAAALSEDLRRYLEGWPVQARPGTLGYRAQKLVRRHRLGVLATLLLAATTAGGIAATVHQARRAERRFQQVRKLANTFLFDLQSQTEALPGETRAREAMVRAALEYLDNLAAESAGDRSLLWELASAYQKVGDLQGWSGQPNLGQFAAARESHQKALAIAEQLASKSRDPKIDRLLGVGHHRLGSIPPVTRTEAALEHYRKALELIEPLYRADPGNPGDSQLLILLYWNRGDVENVLGRAPAASESWKRTLDIAERWYARDPGTQAHLAVALSHHRMALLARTDGDLVGALDHARKELAILQELLAARPSDAGLRRSMMNSYELLARIMAYPDALSFEDRTAALEYHAKVVSMAESQYAADTSNFTAMTDMLIAERDECLMIPEADRQRVIRQCRKALELENKKPLANVGPYPTVMITLARALDRTGRHKEALEFASRALRDQERLVQSSPARYDARLQLVRIYCQVGSLLSEAGDQANAIQDHRHAAAIAEELQAAHPSDLLLRRDLADCYQGLGRDFEAAARTESKQGGPEDREQWRKARE